MTLKTNVSTVSVYNSSFPGMASKSPSLPYRVPVRKLFFAANMPLMTPPSMPVGSVVPASGVAGSAVDTLGVHVHFFTPGDGHPLTTVTDLDRIQQAGFRRVRMDILWSQVEQRPGVFDFTKYDWIIQGLLQRGIRPMVILGLGNPLYNRDLSIQPASTAAAFSRYARETVRHYRGQGLLYELVNEPNHPDFWKPQPNAIDYASLALFLLPQLRQIDPNARFVSPSTAGAPLGYLEACFRSGLLNVVDGVSIHPYQTFHKFPPYKRIPEAFEQECQQARVLIDRYSPPGKHIPLLLGEWGYSSIPGEVDQNTQANFQVRQALLGLMYGSPVNIWYDWKGDIDGSYRPNEKEHNFGMVGYPPYVPFDPNFAKPSYYAMRELSQALNGKNFSGRLNTANPQDYLLAFRDGKQTTIAAWTTDFPHAVAAVGKPLLLTGKPTYTTFLALSAFS
jgi:polysaccharide biosynthesis protein PslG